MEFSSGVNSYSKIRIHGWVDPFQITRIRLMRRAPWEGGGGFAIVQDTEYSKSFQVGLLYDVLEISKPINRQVGPGGHINRHDD